MLFFTFNALTKNAPHLNGIFWGFPFVDGIELQVHELEAEILEELSCGSLCRRKPLGVRLDVCEKCDKST